MGNPRNYSLELPERCLALIDELSFDQVFWNVRFEELRRRHNDLPLVAFAATNP